MPAPPKIDAETREKIIRQWVRATWAEKKQICKTYGISDTLPGYWRRQGYWPKELIVPQEPKKPAALPAVRATVEPRDEYDKPYSIEERKIIKAEWEEARAAALAAGGKRADANAAAKVVVAKYGETIDRWIRRRIDSKLYAADVGTRRRYKNEFKQQVAAAYHAEGGTLKAVGDRFGVGPTQVRDWANKYPPGSVAPVPEKRKPGRPRKGDQVADAMNRALARANGTYHPPAKNGHHPGTVASVLAEAFRRLKAQGTIVTKVETDSDGAVVRITTQTTEEIEL